MKNEKISSGKYEPLWSNYRTKKKERKVKILNDFGWDITGLVGAFCSVLVYDIDTIEKGLRIFTLCLGFIIAIMSIVHLALRIKNERYNAEKNKRDSERIS
jgi:F0F1-type ATP synthase assembly protein I